MKTNHSIKTFFKNQLKPFFNFSIKSIEDVLSLLLGFFVFGVVVFQAATLEITYDEAYTYMNTGRLQNFWKMYQFRIANTHVLNSLLMTITTLFTPYNDLAIRLPNILSSALYISIALSFSKKFKNQLLVFGLFVLFSFQIYFMSLARGYGISGTFILAALFVYHSKGDFKRYHIWIAFLFVLAFYANYVAIAVIIATAIFMFFNDYKRKIPDFKKKELRWLIGLFTIGVYGFFSVTLKGKPLYGAYKKSFMEAIPFEYLSLFSPNHFVTVEFVTGIILTFCVLAIALFLFKKKIRFSIITIITFLIIALMAAVGDKPLPTGRVLIPFWSLLVLSIAELLELIPSNKKWNSMLLRVFNFGIFILLIYNFQRQLEYNQLTEVRENRWKIPLVALADYKPIENPGKDYYIRKDIYHRITPSYLDTYRFKEIRNTGDVIIKHYSDLSVLEMKTNNSSQNEIISGEVWRGDSLIYKSNFPFNELTYKSDKETIRIIVLPNYQFDVIKILDKTGQLIYKLKNSEY